MIAQARIDMSGMPPFLRAVRNAANAGLTAAAIEAGGFMKRGMSKGPRLRSSAPGSAPNVQRGQLRNTITFAPSTNLRSAAGTNVRYGAIQERGGVIRAKGKYLLVPVNDVAKRMSEDGKKMGKARFVPRPGRDPLLIGVDNVRNSIGQGKSAQHFNGQPVFVLKRSVTLPPRPWALPAVMKNKPAIFAAAHAKARSVLKSESSIARGRM